MQHALNMVNSVENILDAVDVLEKRDAYVDAQIAALSRIAGRWWGGFIGAFVAFFITMFASGAAPAALFLLWLVVPAAVLCLIMGIIYNVKKGGWQKQDIENRRLALIQRFFSVLGKDIPRRAKCAVTASFDDYRTHGTKVEEQRGGMFNNVSTSKYEDQWFTARGLLFDGTRFKVSIAQVIHRKEKRKRKYIKVNERVSEDITLLLKLDPQAYPNTAALAGALQPGALEQVQITRVLAQGQLVRITARTPELQRLTGRGGSTNALGEGNLASGDLVLWLMSYVYAQLQGARAPETAA